MPEAQTSALETFDKFCQILQNCVDPKVMIKLFEKQGVFSEGKSPISGPAAEHDHLQSQMQVMLNNIRRHIGVKNAEVFYGLIYAFQTAPVWEYNLLANHLEGQLCIQSYACRYIAKTKDM